MPNAHVRAPTTGHGMEGDADGAGYRNGKKDLTRVGLHDSAILFDIAFHVGDARLTRAVAEACALYADAFAMYATASRISIMDRPSRHGQSDTQRGQ